LNECDTLEAVSPVSPGDELGAEIGRFASLEEALFPVLGRTFLPGEDKSGSNNVAVLKRRALEDALGIGPRHQWARLSA